MTTSQRDVFSPPETVAIPGAIATTKMAHDIFEVKTRLELSRG